MIAAQEARDGERERRIREEAYRLWEEAGRPEGRALEHWSEAKRKGKEPLPAATSRCPGRRS